MGSGLPLLRDPTRFLTRCRAALGDTFLVDAFGRRLLFVFSPEGVKTLYALPEHRASFGLASFTLLRLKVPETLFSGLRNGPHTLFTKDDVDLYLRNLSDAVDVELGVLGAAGEFEVFDEAKRLAHRMGLASWLGEESTQPRYLDRLVPLLDELDAAEAFVRPSQAFRTRLTRHRRERAALSALEGIVAEVWAERQVSGEVRGDFFEQVVASYADLDPADALVQSARDIVLIHLGSQSNLYAALAWTLVDLLLRPDLLAQVREGDDALLDNVIAESIRMAQRSLTLRQVVRPVEVADGTTTYQVPPGAFVATMLSVGNRTAGPGLDRFDAGHYARRRLTVPVATRELVSTFGHGAHSCPAQRFSVLAISLAVKALVGRLELEPAFATAEPRARQIGGVARAARPCPVRFRAV